MNNKVEFNYLVEKKRMIETLARQDVRIPCNIAWCNACPLSEDNNGYDVTCKKFESKYPEEATEVVRKWAEEHPKGEQGNEQMA